MLRRILIARLRIGEKTVALRVGGLVLLLLSLDLMFQGAAFAEAEAQTYDFNIVHDTLGPALDAFVQQADVQLLYPGNLAREAGVNPVIGRFTVSDALSVLLSGTGFSGSLTKGGVIVVSLANSVREADVSKNKTKTAFLAGISPFFLGAANAADLQEVADSAQSAKRDVITVTARKREENIQDVPISITAFGAKDIDEYGAFRIRDLEQFVPNLVFTGPNFNVRPVITVRGIVSSSRNMGFESGVGIYIDGVYLGRPMHFNQELIDIERVEILRGPQGTLFGKNSISGAINVVTRKPTNETDIRAEMEYGNFDYFKASASIGGPIVKDKFFGQIAAYRQTRDGFINNITLGIDEDNEDSYGGRFLFRYTPDDTLEFVLSGDIVEENVNNAHPHIVAGPAPGPAPGTYVSNANIVPIADRSASGLALSVNKELGNGMNIVSISSYRKSTRDSQTDVDFTPLDLYSSSADQDQEQFSQELRLESGDDGKLTYLLGLYYFWQDVSEYTTLDGGSLYPFMAYTDGSVSTKSYAAFGNATYSFTDRFSLNLGLRYTWEDKSLQHGQDGGGVLATVAPFEDSYSSGALSPMVGLQYQVADELMTYASVSRGFKSGGWNAGFITDTNIGFDDETVTNYELGFKAALADNRLKVNTALFWMEYDDLQVRQFLGPVIGTSEITNAGKASSRGVEVDVQANLFEGFNVNAGVGYVDAKYDVFTNATAAGDDYSGNKLQQAPEWTLSVAAQYAKPINDALQFVIRGEYSYKDDFFLQPNNVATDVVPDFSVINGRVGITSRDDRWGLYLWARNLSNKTKLVDNRSSSIGIGTGTLVWYAPPRMWGVKLSVNL